MIAAIAIAKCDDQTHRTLRAVNSVLLADLHVHDGVLIRLAHNLELAYVACDYDLERELCDVIEGMIPIRT